MKFQVIEKPNFVIVEIEGSLTIDNTVKLKEEGLRILKDYKKIIVDLSGVDFIDSSGIGAIAFLDKKFGEENGRLIVTNVPENIALVFSVTRAYEIFEFFDDVYEAEYSLVG